MMTQDERIARLCLSRSETIGPITFHRLIARFGSAEKALELLPSLAKRGGKKASPRIMTVQEASRELKMLSNIGGQLIVTGDELYPEWLQNIEDAPPVLSVLGNAELLSHSCIGIVGARNASINGKQYTKKLACELGQKGQVIASGLARGIDTAAHEASLETGTIAVLAGGIDQIYPRENTDLYHEIIKHGCVVSEMAFGTPPTAHLFPRRNRIVSGVSKGVIVVEASMRSGSLITARLASEQGREVFAVPGFPGDPRGEGPNSLIQNGAKLIQKADDVLEELMTMSAKTIQQPTLFHGVNESPISFEEYEQDTPNEDSYQLILQNLNHTPTDIDIICRGCQIPPHQLQSVLLDLELAGQVLRHPGNRVSKIA
jgi:DNA processing protein